MLTVGRLLSAKVLFAVSIISITALDRKTLKKVDYSLLLTFAGFFIFIGNIGRIGNLQSLFKSFIQGNEVISAVVSSQIISNVPSALLLSGFTSSWRSLLIGVNIGGLGTLIASMASLISYKLFCVSQPESSARYLRYFSVVNFIFLIAMLLIYCLINSIM